MCLTMHLCCSSASEDLGCRRGDFSRKHYGSVELVSPIHTALVCLLLSLCLSVSPHPLSLHAPLLILLFMIPPPFLSLSHCYCLPLFSVGMDGQQRGTDES